MKPSREQAEKLTTPETPTDGVSALTDARSGPERAHASRSRLSDYDHSHFFYGTGADPFDILDAFDKWFTDARPNGYYLFGQPMHTAPGTRVSIVEQKTNRELKDLINFASYNYLGLSCREEVIEAVSEATGRYGTGAAGAPILCGTFDLHLALAEKLARFKKKEAALIFPTGYSANVGTIAGLMRSGDLIVTDQYAHASIIDGMILSKAKVRYFRHNRVEDLDRKLRDFAGKKLVIVEGVYSMDGDLAPLPEIVEVCRRHGARIMVDEAHSTFLYGKNGRGVCEHFGLDDDIDIHFGTFSKSLGGIGGFVAGSKALMVYLEIFARSRMFSCALPPGVVAGLIKAIEIVESEPELRAKLWDNVGIMQRLLDEAGIDTGSSKSQVIPIMVRDDERIFAVAEEMIHEGVYLNPVRYPAVRKHQSRLRISVTASHTEEELTEGARIIAKVLEKYGLCR